MSELWKAFCKAIELIVNLNPEVINIAWRSVRIAGTSTILASLICIPVGGLISFRSFPGKRALINLIQTFYSFPTVCVGLLVFVFFSQVGPLGRFDILFTPAAMIAGQIILICPILLGLTISALRGIDREVKDTALSLGATEFQTIWIIIKEARFGVIAAVIMGFGRAISELGSALIVGGNIRGFTRVLTTAISLETQKGDLELALALGIILICLALCVNIAIGVIQQRY